MSAALAGEEAAASVAIDFATYHALVQLYAAYAYAVDSGDWDLWPGFFVDDCRYRLVPRENHERGLPLATLSFESKGMLKDRVYGIRETLFHDPYYQRHVVGAPLIRAVGPGRIESEANYAAFAPSSTAPARSSMSAATSTSSSPPPTASSSRAAPSSSTAR